MSIVVWLDLMNSACWLCLPFPFPAYTYCSRMQMFARSYATRRTRGVVWRWRTVASRTAAQRKRFNCSRVNQIKCAAVRADVTHNVADCERSAWGLFFACVWRAAAHVRRMQITSGKQRAGGLISRWTQCYRLWVVISLISSLLINTRHVQYIIFLCFECRLLIIRAC